MSGVVGRLSRGVEREGVGDEVVGPEDRPGPEKKVGSGPCPTRKTGLQG